MQRHPAVAEKLAAVGDSRTGVPSYHVGRIGNCSVGHVHPDDALEEAVCVAKSVAAPGNKRGSLRIDAGREQEEAAE
jgi:hypothetical protein